MTQQPLIIDGVDFSDLMTPAEVAQLFRVDVKTVTRWGTAGTLAFIRTLGTGGSGHRRYSRAQVMDLIRGGANTPTYPAPGSTIPGEPGYVVGACGHRVAASEYRAGFHECERCPSPLDGEVPPVTAAEQPAS